MKPTGTPLAEAGLFFALTLGLTWALWLPLALLGIPAANFAGTARGPAWAMVPFLLGGFMPSIVAVVLTAVREGGAGMRALWHRLVSFRIGWRWYVAALAMVVLGTGGQVLVHRLLGGRFEAALFATMIASALPLIVIGPLSEEIGWRGYALDRLQGKLGPIGAGLVVGVAWALWHFPLFLWVGTSQHELAIPFVGFAAGVTALSLLMTWLHNTTGSSTWTAVFFHWIYTYAATVVATGVTRSAAYNWLEYSPYLVMAIVVTAVTGLRRRAAGR